MISLTNVEITLVVAREALDRLVCERDWMGYQLSYEKGLIDDDQFRELEKEYLWDPQKCKEEDIDKKVLALAVLISKRIDAEIVSTIFRIDVQDAEQSLSRVAKQIWPIETTTQIVSCIGSQRLYCLQSLESHLLPCREC